MMALDEVPAVGSYDIDHHTISKKMTKEEEDPDLAVKRAAFNTNAKRWKEDLAKKEAENPYINPHQAHENIEEILMKRKQAQQNHPNFAKVRGFESGSNLM